MTYLYEDIFTLIINELDFYDLLSFCQTSLKMKELCYYNEYFITIKKHTASTTITMDFFNTYYIKDNILYGLGSNRFGQLGISKDKKTKGCYRSHTPVPIKIDNPISVTCNDGIVAILTRDHQLYMMGKRAHFHENENENHSSEPPTKIHTTGKVYYINYTKNILFIITQYGLYAINAKWEINYIPIKKPLYAKFIVSDCSAIMTTNGIYQVEHYTSLYYYDEKMLDFPLKDITCFTYTENYTYICNKNILYIYSCHKLVKQYELVGNILAVGEYNTKNDGDMIQIITTKRYYNMFKDTILGINIPIKVEQFTYYGHSAVISNNNIFYGLNVNPYGEIIYNVAEKMTLLHI